MFKLSTEDLKIHIVERASRLEILVVLTSTISLKIIMGVQMAFTFIRTVRDIILCIVRAERKIRIM